MMLFPEGWSMAKAVFDLDEEVLREAAKELGTKTKEDTVNAALAEVAARGRRERAFVDLIELDEEGAFDKGREPGFKEEVRRARSGVTERTAGPAEQSAPQWRDA
ncbi:hypothetical protein [Streptomyces boninensis]|uniref:hypothetical protein n=1 Tax=Streptomyces boninensis TaxID=2039455 RepID=UPI003B218B91